MFFCEICKYLRRSFDWTPADDCFFFIYEFWEIIHNTFFIEHLWVAEIQPEDILKSFLTDVFQTFY